MNGRGTTWVDGVEASQVPVSDRGLAYGDGVFETLRIRRGGARFLELHLARLTRGCARLRIPWTATELLREEITRAAAGREHAILKVIVTRGDALRRGYAPDEAALPRRILFMHEAPPAVPAAVDVRLAQVRLADQPLLAGIKHLNRVEQVLAAAEAREAGVFDVLTQGMDGRLICGGMSNVFLVSGGRIVTPRLDRAGVAGVMRSVVLRECDVLGIEIAEREVALAELWTADEVFLSNARIGVVPVRRVGEHSVPMDTLSGRLAPHLESLDA